MEWGWIIGALIVFALFGMFKTAKRNNDPMYHSLLMLLFMAAEATDDPYADDVAMNMFMDEVRKMKQLDGAYSTGKKLAHLSTMIPYYGNADAITRSNARVILERLARNGV